MNYDELDPGIRLTVSWLRDHNFETTDSGDGVTKIAAGWPADEVVDVPHVFMTTAPSVLVSDANRLRDLLCQRGIEPEPNMVEASYAMHELEDLRAKVARLEAGLRDTVRVVCGEPRGYADRLEEFVEATLAMRESKEESHG